MLQNQVVKSFNAPYVKMLNEVFNKHTKDKDIVIESLTIQLDDIAIDQFNQQLLDKSREELNAYFEKLKLIETPKNTNRILIGDENNIFYHPLIYYVLHGVYSWENNAKQTFAKSWEKEIESKEFINLITSIRWNKNTLSRLYYQLDKPLLIKTIQKLSSNSQSVEMCQILLEVVLNFQDTTITISSKYNEILWVNAMAFFFESNEKSFSISAFFTYQIDQLSEAFSIDKEELKLTLSETLESDNLKSNLPNASHFPEIVSAIKHLQKPRKSRHVLTSKVDHKSLVTSLLVKSKNTKKETKIIKQWLVNSKHQYLINKLWIETLNEPILKKIVTILVPIGFEYILEYHENVFKFNTISSTKKSIHSLKKAVWSFTIQFLTTSFSSVFQAKAFVFYHSKKMSSYYGFNFSDFIENLMDSIRQISKSRIKYHELLVILKTISNENRNSDEKPLSSTNFLQNGLVNFETLTKILEQSKVLDYQTHDMLFNWFLNTKNRAAIRQQWIEHLNIKVINKIVYILIPQEQFFISQALTSLKYIFIEIQLANKAPKTFDKILYVGLIEYLQLNSGKFSKDGLVEFLTRKLLMILKISYYDFIRNYHLFLNINRATLHTQVEFLTVFNTIQEQFESKLSSHKQRPYGLTINLKALSNTLELGMIFKHKGSGDIVESFSTIEDYLDMLNYILDKDPKRWFLHLKSLNKEFTINTSVFSKMKIGLLRKISLFNANFFKWRVLETKFGFSPSKLIIEPSVVFMFFLEVGTIPSWTNNMNRHQIQNGTLLKRNDTLSLLTFTWQSSAIKNWSFLVPHSKKVDILKAWTKSSKNNVLNLLFFKLFEVYNDMPNKIKPATFFDFEISFWTVFFQTYTTQKTIDSPEFIKLFFKQWQQKYKVSFYGNNYFNKLIEKAIYLPEIISQDLNEDPNVQDTLIKVRTENNTLDLSVIKSKNLIQDTIELQSNNESLSKWYIPNTGLVLIHPFLLHLFKYLNYLDDKNEFKTQDIKCRAVYVVHFIATGQTKGVTEQDTAMSKILCGMQIQEALPLDIVLKKEEIDHAIELLEVVVSRWDKLGETSPDGLRNTFLMRNGQLEYKDNALQLTVESRGTDILIDYIPWSFHIVKLPWADQLIYVSWR